MINNYMDSATNAIPKEYSKLKVNYDYSFTDSLGICYKGENFRVRAATKGTWAINITLKEACLKGDGFFVYILNGSIAHELQMKNPKAANYISYKSDIAVEFIHKVPGFSNICRVFLKEKGYKDQQILITIKNANSYFTSGQSYFFIEYFNKLTNRPLPINNTPLIYNIINRDELGLIRVLGPTVAIKGENYPIHVGAFDKCGNIMENCFDEVMVDEKLISLTNGMAIYKKTFNEEKTYRLKVIHSISGKEFNSNPIVCKESPTNQIFWGDLHAHGWGDKSMHLMHVNSEKISPKARHHQAKMIGRFDFCAVGPMSFPEVNREKIWQEYTKVCNEYDKAYEYIPFLSYEAHPPTGGDRNIFFKSLKEPLPPLYNIPMYEVDELYNKRDDVFVECHIGGKIPRYEDNLLHRERLCEAISAFGNAEWLLHQTIKNGYKPAVCGCSDLHYGLMGGPKTIEESRGRFFKYFDKRDSAFGTGAITAIVTEKLTRNHLWNGLERRSTYATNDDRVYVDFKVNGQLMGETIVECEKYTIDLEVHGSAKIIEISIVCGEYEVEKITPNQFDYINTITLKELPSDYIYIRILQENNGFVLTSPIYITSKFKKWNEQEEMVLGNRANQAKQYLEAVISYLTEEGDINKFNQITPIDIIDESITTCALFKGYLGQKKVSIRWYFEYEVPRIRFDWGFTQNGNINCEIIHNINNPD
ncbi:MAG: hypothetical protein KAG94_00440 [Clostridiales bacterium]|nr:hypothetical protein [Clostridiales bacterium]